MVVPQVEIVHEYKRSGTKIDLSLPNGTTNPVTPHKQLTTQTWPFVEIFAHKRYFYLEAQSFTIDGHPEIFLWLWFLGTYFMSWRVLYSYLYFCRKRSRGITLSIQLDRSPWEIGIHLQGTSYFIGEILPRNHERRTMLSDSRKSLGLHELQTEDYQALKRTSISASYCLTWVALSWKPLFTLFFCCWLFTFSPKLWSTKCLISNNKYYKRLG